MQTPLWQHGTIQNQKVLIKNQVSFIYSPIHFTCDQIYVLGINVRDQNSFCGAELVKFSGIIFEVKFSDFVTWSKL